LPDNDVKQIITPEVLLVEKQQQIDAGLNAFAAELLAESYADAKSSFRFKDKPVLLVNHCHNGEHVYILLTKEPCKDWMEAKMLTPVEKKLTT
jgi:hypothetical protein